MINDILSKFVQTNDNKLKTDDLTIDGHAIITQNHSIQIKNISMIERNEFKSPVTLLDIIVLIILFSLIFIFPPIGFIGTPLYGLYVFGKYQEHLKTKFFIVFNLGSSKNYYISFDKAEFRDKVFNIITKSYNQNALPVYIDIKNQTITNQHNYEKEVTQHNIDKQTNIAGNDNIIAGNFGNNAIVGGKNVATGNSVLVQDSSLDNSNINTSATSDDINWAEIVKELENYISSNQLVLNETTISVLKDLLEHAKAENTQSFNNTVTNNSAILEMIQGTITGTLAGVISGLLIK
ncbi:hypothetical protein [Streptococcus sp. S784/96/1]|uniref:hypothetical protein n=1 Tax=Streptococcus sp. S784/96/1 TaxID=2653499 RepID=UPI0013876506|nr:hypothetical protein [Streptococcus sp. S784/96/1]